MTNHFSELGSIIYSKACDYSSNFPISKDDIKMYYEELISNDVFFPEKVSRRNHLTFAYIIYQKMIINIEIYFSINF